MAQLNFGGVMENVITREEFPLEKAREILKDTASCAMCSEAFSNSAPSVL